MGRRKPVNFGWRGMSFADPKAINCVEVKSKPERATTAPRLQPLSRSFKIRRSRPRARTHHSRLLRADFTGPGGDDLPRLRASPLPTTSATPDKTHYCNMSQLQKGLSRGVGLPNIEPAGPNPKRAGSPGLSSSCMQRDDNEICLDQQRAQ